MPCKAHPPPYPALDSAADFLAFDVHTQMRLWEFRWTHSTQPYQRVEGPSWRAADTESRNAKEANSSLIDKIRRAKGRV